MNFLDMRTLVFSNVVTDILCLLVILLLWRQSRKRFAGTGFWVFDFTFQTTAMFLVILRGNIPDWMSMVLSNTLVIGGAILGYMGLGCFVGRKTSQVHNYLLLAAFACVHAYFALVQPNLAARNLNLSVGLLIICFQCMWLLVYGVESGMRRLTLGVGMVFGVYCLVSIVRIVGFFTRSHAVNNYFQSGAFESLILISYQMLFILLTYSLALMVSKRLLVEVKTQEEKFAKAFQSSPYAITLTRLSDGQIIEVNDGFSNISGYQYAEAIGKTTHDLNLWDKEEDRVAAVNELSKSGKVRGREFQFRKKTGEKITGLFSAGFIPINNQEFVLSSISDITDRKKAEEALRESEARYRSLFEHMLDGFAYCQMLFDEHGHPEDFVYLAVNDAFGRMTGLKDVIGKRVTQVFPRIKELTPELFEIYGRVALTGNPERFEIDFKPLGLYLSVSAYSPAKGYFVAVFDDITERKRAEEALRETEERFRRYFELGLIGMAITSPTKRWLEVNDELCAILGYDRSELAQKTWAEMTHPDDLAADVAQFNRILAGEVDGYTLDKRFLRKDGQVVYTIISVRCVRRPDNSVDYIVVLLQDITARKRAEDQVSRSQKTFAELIECSPFGTYVVDSQFRIAMMNAASQEGAFRNVRPVIGRPFAEAMRILWPEPVAAEIIGRFRHTLDTGEPYHSPPFINPRHDLEIVESYEWELYRLRLPDGQYGVVCYYFDSTKLREAEGALKQRTFELQRLTQTLEERVKERTAELKKTNELLQAEVTERNRAKRELRKTMQILEAVSQNLPALIFAKDCEGRLTYASESTLRVLGKSAEEVLGKTDAEVHHDPHLGEAVMENDRIVRETCRPLVVEEPTRLPDGSLRVFLSTKVPWIAENGTLLGTLGTAVDITDRKRMEEALKERTVELADLSSQLVSAQEKERQRVSYDLHDNVWQMLVAIRFAIDNLFSSQEDWGALRNKSEQVMTDIVDLVGKIRSMQGDLWPYVLDDIGLGATIDWYCREFKKNHSGLVIEMKNGISDRDIPSSAKIVIYRILQETLSNVAKHSQASRVIVDIIKRDHGIEFKVEDNGFGFDPEEIIAKKAPWGGLGLLSIKGRTELSGGTFGIESIKGKGTTVKASWPL